jgi:threonine/homoserine/homoserine lactone efflux protein
MIIAASSRGWGAVIAVVVVYEIATIGTMLILVSTAHAGARAVKMPWLDRYGDAVAGALIVFLGALVTILGI